MDSEHNHSSRSSKWTRRLIVVLVCLGVVGSILWFTETDYYITAPGAAIDTSRLVSVQGGEKHRGNLLMLVVTTEPANLFWYLYAKVDPRAELETKERFLGDIPDYDKYMELSRQMMVDSQQTARAIALQQVGKGHGVQSDGVVVTDFTSQSVAAGTLAKDDVITEVGGKPVRNTTDLATAMRTLRPGEPAPVRVRRGNRETLLSVPTMPHPDDKTLAAFGLFPKNHLTFDIPLTVEVDAGAITGPSAGLMFTLQMIDQLTPGGITHGLRVAGTGTIEADGAVGVIGGVQQKVFAAEAAGAQVMFVPQGNYEAAHQVASHVTLVPVHYVGDAVKWLKSHGGGA